MKKLTLISICLVGFTIRSHAVVAISWFATQGSEVLQADNTTFAPSGWTAQLIWTPDGVRDAVDNANPFVPSNDDVVLVSQAMNTIGTDGQINGPVAPNDEFADSFAGGFIYTRVFNTDFGNAGTTATLFGESSNQTGPLVVFNMFNPLSRNLFFASGVVVNQVLEDNQVIPEPSTYALVAFGGLVMIWRHRRSRDA